MNLEGLPLTLPGEPSCRGAEMQGVDSGCCVAKLGAAGRRCVSFCRITAAQGDAGMGRLRAHLWPTWLEPKLQD